MEPAGITGVVFSASCPSEDVDRAVWPTRTFPRHAVALAQEANDLLAATVTTRPDCFQGLAALPTSAPGAAAEEFECALTGLGLDGAMLFGRTGSQHLDLWPVYEVAERRGAPLHVHPQSPVPAMRNAYYKGFEPAVEAALATFGVGWHYDAGVEFLRMVIAGVFDRFPQLQVVVGHWGELVLFFLARVRPLRAPTNTCGRLSGGHPITVPVTHGKGRVRGAPRLGQQDRCVCADSTRLTLALPVAE
jgi:predicted TIM-barrel fold metal-dependent hydrolase